MTREEQASAIEQSMRQHRFDEAIARARALLTEHPNDLETLLRLGICYLLSRAEEDFVKVHGRAQQLVELTGEPQGQLAQLWRTHQRLVTRLGAPLLVAGSAVLAACDRKPDVMPEPEPTAAPADAASASSAVSATSQPSHPQGEELSPPGASEAPSTAPDATTEPKPSTVSAHRYSAGVYRPPKPATHHKYSAGVYRRPPSKDP